MQIFQNGTYLCTPFYQSAHVSQKSYEPNLSSAPSLPNLPSGHLGKICLWLKSHLKLKKEKKSIINIFNF